MNKERHVGSNSRKFMLTKLDEVHKEIQQHMADIRAKFIDIIHLSTNGQIQESAKVDYDKKIEKGDTITANKHIH